ncbi:hypothetical protein [Prevotella sp. oral taxon 376]|nr:hypothetical protein [Prevotella sp. oral taxon 376]
MKIEKINHKFKQLERGWSAIARRHNDWCHAKTAAVPRRQRVEANEPHSA